MIEDRHDRHSQAGSLTGPQDGDDCNRPNNDGRPPVVNPQPITIDDRLADTIRIVREMATALNDRRQDNEKSIARVEPFYGEGQDPELWIEEFEKAKVANRWSNDRALSILPVYLKGNAGSWWTNNNFYNYNNFVAAFRNYFRTSARIMTWRMELDTRYQRDNESIETYAASLRELFRKIPINNAEEQVRHFIKGVRSEYTTALCSEELRTLDAAVNKARRLETSTAYQRMRQAMIGDTEQNKTLTMLQNQVAALRADFQRKPEVQFERQTDLETARNTQRNSRPAFEGVCYGCGKKGHMRKDCRNKRQNPNRQQQYNGPPGGYSNMPYQNNNQYPAQNFGNQYQPNQWQNQGPPPPANYRNDARYQPAYNNQQPAYNPPPRYNTSNAHNNQSNNWPQSWYYNQQEQPPPQNQPHYRNEPSNDDDLRQRLHDLLNLKD